MRLHLSRSAWRPIPFVLLAGAILVGLVMSACTSGDDSDRVRDLEARIATLEADLDAARAAAPAAGDAAAPAAPPATERIDGFGFALAVPADVQFQAVGTSGSEATEEAGQVAASDGSVSMSLLWATATLTPEETVVGAFDLLRAAAADLLLQPTNQGAMTVDGQVGAFGTFQAQEAGAVRSVGIVGGWSCGARSFALTVLGVEVATVEQAFAGLVEGFSCGS